MSIPNTIMTAVKKPIAIYIGSSTDLPPALFYPEYDWVFITSDGTGYWRDHLPALETIEGFMQELAQQVHCVSHEGNVITCKRDDGSQVVTIYYATKFPDLDDACRAAVVDARLCWFSGWAPTASQRAAIRILCPRLETCVVNGCTFQSRFADLRLVEVPEYDRNGEFMIEVKPRYAEDDYSDFVARAMRVGWSIVWNTDGA